MNNIHTEISYMAKTHGKMNKEYYASRKVTIGYSILDGLDMTGKLVLDIGAFAGFVANYCRKMGAIPVLVDIYSGSFPDDMFSIQASNDFLPFLSDTFDYVVCDNSLHHGNLDGTVAEVFRVLKVGGTFVSVCEPCIHSSENEQERLERDCGKLIAAGVCERRPNLFQYQHAFRVFSDYRIYNGVDLGQAVDHDWGGSGIVIQARKT